MLIYQFPTYKTGGGILARGRKAASFRSCSWRVRLGWSLWRVWGGRSPLALRIERWIEKKEEEEEEKVHPILAPWLTCKPGQGTLGRRTATWPGRLSSYGIPSSIVGNFGLTLPTGSEFHQTRPRSSVSCRDHQRDREPLHLTRCIYIYIYIK